MRILSLHCDKFEYRPEWTAALGGIESSDADGMSFVDCLLLLISVEPGDELEVVAAAKAIRRVIRKTGVKSIVLNAFAHLSDSLADLATSESVMQALERRLADTGINVHVAPFGWHKRMTLEIRADVDAQKFLHV